MFLSSALFRKRNETSENAFHALLVLKKVQYENHMCTAVTHFMRFWCLKNINSLPVKFDLPTSIPTSEPTAPSV